jgi:predicted RNase H-like HicB family nuclease
LQEHDYSREKTMKLKIVLEPSLEGGYAVYVPSLPGCISEGNSREEALANIREAISLYLEPTEDNHIDEGKGEVVELAVRAIFQLL